MKISSYIKSLLAGLGLWLFFGLILMYGSNNSNYTIIFSAFLACISVCGSLVVKHWLMPVLVEEQNSFRFLTRSISIILVVSILILAFNILCIGFLPGLNVKSMPLFSRSFYTILFLEIIILSFSAFIEMREHQLKSLRENYELKQIALEKEVESKNQELNLLKSQIQPHFLFNSLNTIYGQALKKSDATASTILELSELLDYILYCTQKESVALETEVKQIERLIQLEKIRFNDTLEVSFDYPETADSNISVPPMLFLPFVENAFKHGKQEKNKLKCSFSLRLENGAICFRSKNRSGEAQESDSGIGLKNIRRRLDLLYGQNYSLNLGYAEGYYLAELVIPKTRVV
ncbi:MAG: histidine kinase [Cytophagia bacterium]|nr:histidine kinase [Cytophagia bacterium]